LIWALDLRKTRTVKNIQSSKIRQYQIFKANILEGYNCIEVDAFIPEHEINKKHPAIRES